MRKKHIFFSLTILSALLTLAGCDWCECGTKKNKASKKTEATSEEVSAEPKATSVPEPKTPMPAPGPKTPMPTPEPKAMPPVEPMPEPMPAPKA